MKMERDYCTETQAAWLINNTHLPVALLQVVQALSLGLFADVGLEDNEVFTSSLLS